MPCGYAIHEVAVRRGGGAVLRRRAPTPWLFVWATAWVAAWAAACAPAEYDAPPDFDADFTFAVIGDVPYTPAGEALFPELVAQLDSSEGAWVLHVGDVKGGSIPCTDSLLVQRAQAVAAIAKPVIYLPGDNEWTDCHRNPSGRYAPLERLARVRELFYPVQGLSTGQSPMEVETQASDSLFAEFPEHQRWARDGVVFFTVHAVGSLNGLVDFDTRTPADDAEVDRRIAASLAWIRDSFASARAAEAPAVVLAIHANPWDTDYADGGRTGFEEFFEVVGEEIAAFARPVLLVHGDTHTMRVDHPEWTPETGILPNLTRLEGYGSPRVGWVEVLVDADGPEVFAFRTHLLEP